MNIAQPAASRATPAAAAGQHPQRAAGRRNLLPDRVGLGPLAAVVAQAFSPQLCPPHGRVAQGDCRGAPWEILDPRDLKYCRNLCSCNWAPDDDHFRWRGRLGLARWGLAELLLMGGPLVALVVLAAWFFWYLAPLPAAVLCLVVFFFRDPPRRIPQSPGLVVSPADGTIAEIARLEHDDFIDGPAVRIGIFLSIFNVHLNRAPLECRVIALRYTPGEFLNALRPESALRNENLWIGLEDDSPPHRRLAVRQISGAIARRIVCELRPGESLGRGQKFGMIKLGSRTELILPDVEGLSIEVAVGRRVKAGRSVAAQFADPGVTERAAQVPPLRKPLPPAP